jgi:hypothetical protein
MTSSKDLAAGSQLRSAQWYAGDDRNAYIHRAWMRRGVPGDAFTGRPHIAIANTASDLTPCNAHLTEVAASVKNGVYEAGGIPLELPVVSLGETLLRPTAMLWRNTATMATEEMLRASQSDRRRCAARRLRQDHPVLTHGGCLGRPTRCRGARWADADRHLPRRCTGLRHRRLAVVGGGPGRHPLRGAVHPLGVGHDPQPWALQHHGHRVNDGARRRGARHGRPRRRRHTRSRQSPARGRPRDPVGWSWRWSPPTDGRAHSLRLLRSPTRS